MKIVYFDTETTGLVPGQIAQLSMIIENNRNLTGINYFFTVDEMEEAAQKVHGFSKEKLDELSGGYRFIDRIHEIDAILKDSILVAHNIGFDIKFLYQEYWRANMQLNIGSTIDTMERFKEELKIPAKNPRYGKYKNPKLSEVIEHYGLSEHKIREYAEKKLFQQEKSGDYHNAIFDTTAMMVAVMCEREKTTGSTVWIDSFKL